MSTSYREGLTPLLTREETKHYAVQAVLRAAIRKDFASKLGLLKYSIGTYDRLIRATVPVMTEDNLQAKFFLRLSFDVGSNVKEIIENELLPYINKNLELFNKIDILHNVGAKRIHFWPICDFNDQIEIFSKEIVSNYW